MQLIRDPGSSWSSYPELSGEIIVPAEVTYENTAFRVTSIGEHAFGNNSGITAVTLPDILETIGESAFSGCYALELTYLPDSIRRLDDMAFQYSGAVVRCQCAGQFGGHGFQGIQRNRHHGGSHPRVCDPAG